MTENTEIYDPENIDTRDRIKPEKIKEYLQKKGLIFIALANEEENDGEEASESENEEEGQSNNYKPGEYYKMKSDTLIDDNNYLPDFQDILESEGVEVTFYSLLIADNFDQEKAYTIEKLVVNKKSMMEKYPNIKNYDNFFFLIHFLPFEESKSKKNFVGRIKLNDKPETPRIYQTQKEEISENEFRVLMEKILDQDNQELENTSTINIIFDDDSDTSYQINRVNTKTILQLEKIDESNIEKEYGIKPKFLKQYPEIIKIKNLMFDFTEYHIWQFEG